MEFAVVVNSVSVMCAHFDSKTVMRLNIFPANKLK